MKTKQIWVYPSLSLALILLGCATSEKDGVEKGPQGTIAYYVPVETSEPGARIEIDGEDAGKSPCTLKIYGDKDGTFHNFGKFECVIKAYPVRAGERVQVKVFRTGGWFTQEDRIPKRIYFDMNPK